MQADPRFDDGVAPTGSKDPFTDVEEAVARLVHASFPPDARARGPASDGSAAAHISQSFVAATLGAADLGPPIPREQRSLGKRGALACVAVAVCLGAFAIWAWRLYGGHAGLIATRAPLPAATAANEPGAASAERQQIETMADLAALRQTVEQLAASQEQLTREIAKLQAEKPDKRMLRRASAPPAPQVAAPAHKPAPLMALMPQPANPPPLRPTMPVTQP